MSGGGGGSTFGGGSSGGASRGRTLVQEGDLHEADLDWFIGADVHVHGNHQRNDMQSDNRRQNATASREQTARGRFSQKTHRRNLK